METQPRQNGYTNCIFTVPYTEPRYKKKKGEVEPEMTSLQQISLFAPVRSDRFVDLVAINLSFRILLRNHEGL